MGLSYGCNTTADKLFAKRHTTDKVRYIRTSNKSIIELSTELSVSKHCIWDALHKRSWKDVN